jgi:hypothetical protein
MAKFCENCPLRGRATGEIDRTAFQELAEGHDFMGQSYETDHYYAGVVLDDKRNPSLPIREGTEDVHSIAQKVETCEGPEIQERKFLFIRLPDEVTCPALGRLALKPYGMAYNHVAKQVGGY